MQPLLSLLPVDTKTVTGTHVLEPPLRSIPRIYSELIVAALALDSALGGALSLLGVRWPNHGVPIYAANGGTRSAPRTPSRRATDNENMLHRSRDNYWKELAEECLDHGVGVGVSLTPDRYIDVATLGMYIDPKPVVLIISLVGVVARITGGDMYFLPRFDPDHDVAVLYSYTSQIMRHEMGYQCTFRLRCSNGLR